LSHAKIIVEHGAAGRIVGCSSERLPDRISERRPQWFVTSVS
jgi:hypothetical protein